jgi:NADPH-dependent curcumin reductase CurA
MTSAETIHNRQWLLVRRPGAEISELDFELRETAVPEPSDGEMLVRTLWLSFDPTQRGWMSIDTYVPMIPLGEPMRAIGVGQVLKSRREGFATGDLVQAMFLWQDYVLVGDGALLAPMKLPPGTPPNLALGLFGGTGLTAYFGTLDVGQPVAGETFVVSAAAGATGSVAGQIAKIQGCRVIGIAGGAEKCAWLTGEAGFDEAIDYKAEDVGQALERHCPAGIDVYFDNVGGDTLDAVLARLARRARIVVCGAISRYGEMGAAAGTALGAGPANYFNLVLTHGRMEGFLLMDYADRFPEALAKLLEWYGEGRIRHREDVQEGLENAPTTLMRLFSGANLGKQLLHVADPD